MDKFLLMSKSGSPLLIAEADSEADAEYYGQLVFPHTFDRLEPLEEAETEDGENTEAKIKAAFQRLGLSDKGAAVAAAGRQAPSRIELRTVRVPSRTGGKKRSNDLRGR